MGFTVNEIILKNFRNHSNSKFLLGNNLTILSGLNGAGKTNIIEAIQLVTEGYSFRNPTWGDVVSWGNDECYIQLLATDEKRVREVELNISSGRRHYVVNGKKVRSANDIIGQIPIVLFTPNDLNMVKNGSEKRRDEIDSLGSQLSKNYALIKSEYQKIVSQRNRLIKEGITHGPLFDAWSEQLLVVGASLYKHRRNLFNRLGGVVDNRYKGLSNGATLSTQYVSSVIIPGDSSKTYEQLFKEQLQKVAKEEVARGYTLVGPHRDDIMFLIDGKDARHFGSQGQQRTVALAWKLAEVNIVHEITGYNPLLLLDDVMSELDENKRKALMRVIGSGIQTIITSAHIKYFSKKTLDQAHVIHIEGSDKRDEG